MARVETLRPSGTRTAGGPAVYLWLDATIRNERQGIRILRVPATSAAHRTGFREGDLLTHMNGSPTGSVEGLIGIISGAAYGKTEFRVTRGERSETLVADGPGGVPAVESP
jgi:S1-C subfamily serine protease